MSDDDLFGRALAKLSEEDQHRAIQDLLVHGSAIIEEMPDGSVRLVNPMKLHIRELAVLPMPDLLKPKGEV